MQRFAPQHHKQTRSLFELAGSLWKKPTQRKVLVIGGAGYIGSALLPRLLKRGHRVRVLDRLFYGTEPIKHVINHPNLEIAQADFREINKIVECMQGVDAVIHLGAIVGDPACALDRDLTIEVNLMATRAIAEVAKGIGVRRFIFASTCSVYGASQNDELLDENSRLNPVSLYALSKLASEKVVMDLACETFSPTILRFSTIYGLSGRTRFDLVLNLLTAMAVMDGHITIQGGDQWRPFLHVDDAAIALLTTLESALGRIHKEVFNVGSDEQNYTIQQAGELIQNLVPASRLINLGSGGDRRNYRASFSKIRQSLGFIPKWTVEDGIRQVIDIIHRGEVKDYREARYSNVRYLIEQENTAQLVRHDSNWADTLLAQISLACQGAVHERQVAISSGSVAIAA